ncbi:MAG: hypothetical protein CM1200mP35_09610 [Chloroflexota bacterium]|nr:MAG: hypothetical protein CM1200mP35_09610 [Chloroflexota bacterium]
MEHVGKASSIKILGTVLVLSASAGVGTAAIQVAKRAIGARVIATTSTSQKVTQAQEWGADEVINYNEEDISERVKDLTHGDGVDVVVDHVGADFFPLHLTRCVQGGDIPYVEPQPV